MKEFIAKINDRNLQRRRESGLTSYVIYSIFFLILYKLFTSAEFLLTNTQFESKNIMHVMWVISFTYNALFNLGLTINYLFPNISVFENIRLFKRNKIDSYVFLSFIMSFPLGLFLICYTYFTIPINSILFNIYSAYILLINLFGIYEAVVLYKKNKKSEFIITESRKQSVSVIKLIDLVISFMIIGISCYYIFLQEIEYKSQIIKILILLYLSYAVIEKILQSNLKDNYYTKLEDFEYEIKLKNLSDEDISKQFQDKFLGFFINDWIQIQIKIFDYRRYDHEESILYLQDQLVELSREYSNDENNLQYKTRENTILSKIDNQFKNYQRNLISQIHLLKTTFLNNSKNLEIIEKQTLLNLISKVEEENRLMNPV